MEILRVHETTPRENADAVSRAFLHRTVVSCGVAQFEPGSRAHEGERHVHDYDEVFIVLQGEITVPITDGPTDVARAGDWVLVAAGEEHHLTNHTHLPCTAVFLTLERM